MKLESVVCDVSLGVDVEALALFVEVIVIVCVDSFQPTVAPNDPATKRAEIIVLPLISAGGTSIVNC